MSYEKQTFKDGQVLTAAHLNHIEDGIATVEASIPSASPTAGLTETEKALLLALFGDATYKTETGAAKLAELTALWGGSAAPQEVTIRTSSYGEGDTSMAWSTTTPKTNYIPCPFSVKKALTLKKLRFLVTTDNALGLRVGVSDVTSGTAVDLDEQAVPSVAGTTEVNYACSIAMEAGKKYRIWVVTSDNAKTMAYPLLMDESVAENDYFSIVSETAGDYLWSNAKIKFMGWVTVEV